MPKTFKCIKEFVVDKYDEHERLIENEHVVIPVGSVWERSDYPSMCDVRLESDELGWLELNYESLKECFVEV